MKIWLKAIDLSTSTYRLVSSFSIDEKFGLSSQIRRSVISIASNIAEGAGRNTDKEFLHFMGIANGSSYELQTQIIIAMNLNLIELESGKELLKQIDEIQKMIYGFRNKLRAIK